MVKDNPSDNIFNYFYDAVFSGHPLSLSILGTRKSLGGLGSDQISNFFNNNFNLGGIVLSAAGNVKHKDLVEKVKQNISELKEKNFFPKEPAPIQVPSITSIKKIYKGNTEASHICYGGLGCDRLNKERFPLALFLNLLGGSMSSRLFQKIREEKGLSYTIFASGSHYVDTGVIIIYAATSPNNVYKVIDLIKDEISDIKLNGIKKSELEIAKENSKGDIVLGVEDISSRMFRLGKALLVDGKVLTIDEILKKIDQVKLEDINDVVHKYFQTDKMNLVIIGKTSNGRPR
jgi:predicted Zn-dependent peptidase